MAFQFIQEAALSKKHPSPNSGKRAEGGLSDTGKNRGESTGTGETSSSRTMFLSDVALVRKIFALDGEKAARGARNMLAPGAEVPCRFTLDIESKQYSIGQTEEHVLYHAAGLLYFLKREFGDTFSVTGEAMRKICEILGQEDGEKFISSVSLPVSLGVFHRSDVK